MCALEKYACSIIVIVVVLLLLLFLSSWWCGSCDGDGEGYDDR